jgi:hypothetical protein
MTSNTQSASLRKPAADWSWSDVRRKLTAALHHLVNMQNECERAEGLGFEADDFEEHANDVRFAAEQAAEWFTSMCAIAEQRQRAAKDAELLV